MNLKDILDLPERKQSKKNRNDKSYFLLLAAFLVIGISYLIKNINPEIFTLMVILSGIFFILYQIFNFILWDNKKPGHYFLFFGNVGLTSGLILKILSISISTEVIYISIGMIFLSFVIPFVINNRQ